MLQVECSGVCSKRVPRRQSIVTLQTTEMGLWDVQSTVCGFCQMVPCAAFETRLTAAAGIGVHLILTILLGVLVAKHEGTCSWWKEVRKRSSRLFVSEACQVPPPVASRTYSFPVHSTLKTG